LSKADMSNPNGLPSQKLCHHLNQGRTLNDILMRATHWTTYYWGTHIEWLLWS